MGEMPPKTRRKRGFSALTASAAAFTSRAYTLQPGSISKFQCDRLFGSFQNMTASTTGVPPSTDVDFLFRMVLDLEPCAAQHGLRARTIGNPPVSRIMRVASARRNTWQDTRPFQK